MPGMFFFRLTDFYALSSSFSLENDIGVCFLFIEIFLTDESMDRNVLMALLSITVLFV